MPRLLPALFLLAGCVTSADLRDISDSLAELEHVVGDPNSSSQAITDQIAETRADVAKVATKVEERTESFADAVSEVGQGGIIPSILAGLYVWFARNRREEKRWGSPDAPKGTPL